LKKFQLDWWVDELNPILAEFIKSSKGEVDQQFWQSMFRYRSQKGCTAPDTINGWFVKFFPYDVEGKRNNLKEITNTNKIPKGIVKVDLEYMCVDGGKSKNTQLELWSGFMGLKQNSETFALKPEIGWMIRKKDTINAVLLNKLKSENISETTSEGEMLVGGGIKLRIKYIPAELFQLKEIYKLYLNFVDEINIPDKISKIKIGKLYLTGKISNAEINRICKLLPNTELTINEKKYK
jgi:hypothetical protein